MTDQQPHTPTTREVIEVWEHHSNWSISDFDRWYQDEISAPTGRVTNE